MFTAIFDLDGTLVDTAMDLMAAGNLTYEELGWNLRLSWSDNYAVAIAGGRSMIRYGLRSQGISQEKNIVDDIYPILLKNYDKTIVDNAVLYDGIKDSLESLSLSGWNIGLCTNKPEFQADVLLSKMGIRSYFASFIGADTVGIAKPSPIPLIAAIERANGKTENAILIGDTKTDFNTAAAAKTKFLLVEYGHGWQAEDMRDLVVDGSVKSAKELPEVLKKIFDVV